MKSALEGILLCALFFCLLACSQKRQKLNVTREQTPSFKDSVFMSPYGGYGYDILVNGKVTIHQPQIPAIAGNIGFASAADAKKTAHMVIAKLKQNQFPPVLVTQELKELGIIP